MLKKDRLVLETLISKYGKRKINESLRGNDNVIKDMLNLFASSSSGVQSALYKQKAKDATSVDIVSVYDIFTEEEVKQILKYIRPKVKECYKNAYNMADVFQDRNVEYVEGYLNMGGLPIEHAFNVIDGKYFDITLELVTNKKFPTNRTNDTYVSIGTFNLDEVRRVLLQNGYYGQIYETLFLNNYKE